jgi:hypothetical protein
MNPLNLPATRISVGCHVQTAQVSLARSSLAVIPDWTLFGRGYAFRDVQTKRKVAGVFA